MGAATASGGGRAPIASFWVRNMTSYINIKRGVQFIQVRGKANIMSQNHVKQLAQIQLCSTLKKIFSANTKLLKLKSKNRALDTNKLTKDKLIQQDKLPN